VARLTSKPGHEVHGRRPATAVFAAQLGDELRKRPVRPAQEQQAHGHVDHAARARAVHVKPAIRPVRKPVMDAEVGWVHPGRVELPGVGNKERTVVKVPAIQSFEPLLLQHQPPDASSGLWLTSSSTQRRLRLAIRAACRETVAIR